MIFGGNTDCSDGVRLNIRKNGLVVERRRLQRTVIGHPAKVAAGDETIYRCVVHNVTGLGICVELDFSAEQLPEKMAFSFDNSKTTQTCKFIWSEGYVAGIEFDQAPYMGDVSRAAVLKPIRSEQISFAKLKLALIQSPAK